MRSVIAVVAGIVVGGVMIYVGEAVGHWMYPPPPDLDPTTEAGRAAILARATFGAQLSVILAYAVGAFVGGLTAGRVAAQASVAHAVVVGVVLTIGGISNLLSFPHPHGMALATLIVFLPSAYLGGKLSKG